MVKQGNNEKAISEPVWYFMGKRTCLFLSIYKLSVNFVANKSQR